jgi:hypothetical protein
MRSLVCLLVLLLCSVAFGANDLARSPMMIDTAMTTSVLNTGVRITNMRWVNVTTAGHKLILNDSTGRKIFEATCPSGASEYELPLPLSSARGLIVTRIDSGLLYVSYE